MQKDISIFIAGATENTAKERQCLKAVANDMISKYKHTGISSIKAVSYENFKDNQNRYNDFIEQDADIVFFVLKGKMGDKTKEEFLKAGEAWRKKTRPEIVVFLEKESKDETTSEFGEIKGLMEGLLKNQYYVVYSSIEQLQAAAENRIDMFIRENSTRKTVKRRFSDFFHLWQSWLMIFMALISAGVLFWHAFSHKPMLVFAGGGSAARYIKETRGIDVSNFSNSIYLRMPSSQSWNLLAEEANRVILQDSSENKFYPISLSADEAPEDVFVKACQEYEFKRNVAIISYYLGEDTLILYLTNNICEDYGLKNEVIEKTDLDMLINRSRNDGTKILHTTPTSGTIRAWQLCMSDSNAKFIERDSSSIFNEYSTHDILESHNRNRYVVLGSKYYFMRHLKATEGYDSVREKTVSIDGQIISKPIYLYFVAYVEHDKLRIPNEVVRFLKKLKISDDEIWKEKHLEIKKDGWYIDKGAPIVNHLKERPNK